MSSSCYCCGRTCYKIDALSTGNLTCIACLKRTYDVAGVGHAWAIDFKSTYYRFDGVVIYSGWLKYLKTVKKEGYCPQCGEKHD
jgi:hypothetical protein